MFCAQRWGLKCLREVQLDNSYVAAYGHCLNLPHPLWISCCTFRGEKHAHIKIDMLLILLSIKCLAQLTQFVFITLHIYFGICLMAIVEKQLLISYKHTFVHVQSLRRLSSITFGLFQKEARGLGNKSNLERPLSPSSSQTRLCEDDVRCNKIRHDVARTFYPLGTCSNVLTRIGSWSVLG